jgi:hypothetical protein
MRNAKKQFISLALCLILLIPTIAMGQTSTGSLWDSQLGVGEVATVYGQDKNNTQDLRITIVKIINTSMLVLGIVFFVLFILSGFQWMTAGGNDDAVKKAKSRMSNAVIGLTIALVSWSVTLFIMRRLVAITTGKANYINP